MAPKAVHPSLIVRAEWAADSADIRLGDVHQNMNVQITTSEQTIKRSWFMQGDGRHSASSAARHITGTPS